MMGIDLIITAGGAIAGYLMKYMSMARKERHAEHLRAMDRGRLAIQSHESAAERGGIWIRRAIVAVSLLAVLVAPLITAFLQLEIVYPYVKEGGSFLFGLFESGETIEFEKIQGYLLSPEARQTLTAIVSFYFGQAAAK